MHSRMQQRCKVLWAFVYMQRGVCAACCVLLACGLFATRWAGSTFATKQLETKQGQPQPRPSKKPHTNSLVRMWRLGAAVTATTKYSRIKSSLPTNNPFNIAQAAVANQPLWARHQVCQSAEATSLRPPSCPGISTATAAGPGRLCWSTGRCPYHNWSITGDKNIVTICREASFVDTRVHAAVRPLQCRCTDGTCRTPPPSLYQSRLRLKTSCVPTNIQPGGVRHLYARSAQRAAAVMRSNTLLTAYTHAK